MYHTPYSTFSEVLIFPNLMWLVWPAHDGLQDITSAQNLQIPALKSLKLTRYKLLDAALSAMIAILPPIIHHTLITCLAQVQQNMVVG
jgi:hypothetical protein